MYVSEELYQKILEMRKGPADMPKISAIGKEIQIPTRAGQARVLYHAARTPNAPAFFNVHGGGFIMGTPESDDKFCHRLCEELDVAVFNIDYRLAPEYPCPNDKEDVYDVIRFVASHSSEFSVDPEKMGVGGHSAGGNISAVVCLMAKEKKEFSLRCQVLDYPPLDLFTDPHEKFYTEGAIPPQVAETFDSCYRKKENAKDIYCSPYYATQEQLTGLPPAVVLTCEIDSLRDETEEYGLKLARAGVETTIKRFSGVAHGFTPIKEDRWEEGQQLIISFLRKHLLGQR